MAGTKASESYLAVKLCVPVGQADGGADWTEDLLLAAKLGIRRDEPAGGLRTNRCGYLPLPTAIMSNVIVRFSLPTPCTMHFDAAGAQVWS